MAEPGRGELGCGRVPFADRVEHAPQLRRERRGGALGQVVALAGQLAEGVEDVARAADEQGAVAQQRVRARRERAGDAAGDGGDGAPELRAEVGRRQRP